MAQTFPDPLVHDPDRLAALAAYEVLDSVPEAGFDDLAQLAALACAAPVALVSLVEADRQWFKAQVGFPARETGLDRSVCKLVLAEPDLLVIRDLAEDARTRTNPLVTGEPRMRFYAGAPLRTPEGHVLGSLCVIDTVPRPDGLTPAQAEHLRRCARQVMRLLELRRAMAERDAVLRSQDVELRREHHLAVLAEASAALLTASDPSRVIEPILATNTASLGFEQCYIYDLAEDGCRVRLTGSIGVDAAVQASLRDVAIEHPLCGIVVQTDHPLVLENVQAGRETRYAVARETGLDAYAGYPIRSRGRLVGVISFAAAAQSAFAADALTFFATIARYLSAVRERLDGEAALRASEARARLAQEAGRVGTYEVDIASGLMAVSPEFCRLFGLTVAPLYAVDTIVARIVPEDAHLASTDASRGAGAGPLEVVYRIRRADDGALRWLRRVAAFECDAGGKPARVFGTVQDITDAQETLQLLRENEAHLRTADERLQMALTASGAVGLWDWMVDTDLLHGDANFARLYGLDVATTAAGITMEQYQAFVVPEDIAPLRAAIRDTFDHGADFLVEYRLTIPGEPLRWVECKGRRILDANGRPVRFSGTAVDITARRTAEAEARRLAAIVEQSGDFIGVARLDGTVAWVNEAGRRMVGLADAAAVERTRIQDYFEPEQWAWIVDTVLPVVTRDGHWRGELRFRHFTSGDLIPVIYDIIALRDPRGAVTAYATVTRDITERRRAEERQDVLNHELSHRLKNTLAVVTSIANQTLRAVPEREPVESFLKRVRALSTAHDVLLSRDWTQAPLRTVCADALGVVTETGRITLDGPDLALGPTATMSLSLLLHELATNAAKYGALSTPAGRVDLGWRVEDGTPGEELVLDWRERGGPSVVAPARRGFGSRLIRMGLVGTGGVAMAYPPQGFEASMRAPLIEVQRS